MEWVDVIILSLLHGVTEFLPISSTGHLALAQDWLALDVVNELALGAMFYFATTAAAMFYFWSDIWNLLQVLMRKLGRLPVNERDINLLKAVAIGSVPALISGLLMESYFLEHFQTPLIVSAVLFVGSIFFMYTEWRYYLRPNHSELTVRHGWQVGLFQMMALLPGMSRSGITIAGGMLMGMTRYESTRFSFLLAIPVMLGAGIRKIMELLGETTGSVEWTMVIGGSIITFMVALLVIHSFLQFIRKYSLWSFVWYGIILAGMVWYVEFIT